jgi:hypothetical protein
MKRLPVIVASALYWYALIPLSALVVGELAFFPWPHIFMMWLRWDSWFGLAAALIIGALAIAGAGFFLDRFGPFRTVSPARAALIGLLLAVATLGILLATAWTVATLAGWPTSA